ncbi:unnamed protein product [Strongylus vulgaris]|uniref:Uncharacterized protein n=1 Tax=Strongylus vulgaris TaxID=40348 RepID=A0A3P7K068_STRVU|nr:unnamed protein product [Strongylus vulgaris]
MRKCGGDGLKESIDRLESVSSEILDMDLGDHLSEKLGMKPVLCQGDMWSTNMIWRQGDKGIELAAIVDFQLKQAYKLFFPLGAFLIVPMIGPLFQFANNRDDVEYKAKVG